jgi:hypothetical protein
MPLPNSCYSAQTAAKRRIALRGSKQVLFDSTFSAGTSAHAFSAGVQSLPVAAGMGPLGQHDMNP